jgi:hypothetical protein
MVKSFRFLLAVGGVIALLGGSTVPAHSAQSRVGVTYLTPVEIDFDNVASVIGLGPTLAGRIAGDFPLNLVNFVAANIK